MCQEIVQNVEEYPSQRMRTHICLRALQSEAFSISVLSGAFPGKDC